MRSHTLIIAEAGVNHNGSMVIAKKLIDAAAKAGADYIKFQSYRTEHLVTATAKTASYQKVNTRYASQVAMLKKLELSEQQHKLLAAHAGKRKIKFLSTPFDFESIKLLKKLKMTIGKIPSGEITNLPYMEKMAQSFNRIILSTGMATMEEIEAALRVLYANGIKRENITLLHCTTEYPAPYKDVNLNAMQTMKNHFGVAVGYSDHTTGIEIAIAAVAMGAEVIEKHFTLSRALPGPDHKASLEPGELMQMVSSIRNVEIALGSGIKKPAAGELLNRSAARKSIVAARDIIKGEQFTADNLTVKRPGTGISPMQWNNVIGRYASRNYKRDDLIRV